MGFDTKELGAVCAPTSAPAAASRSWYRDPHLWTAVGVALGLKLGVLWLMLGSLRRVAQVQQLHADLRGWNDFFRAVRAGGVPYVDVATSAPVLTACWYWLLAKLPGVLAIHSTRPLVLCSALLMGVADLFNAGLVYTLAREVEPRSALRTSVVCACSLSALLLGPTHIDPWVVSCLLVAYRLDTLQRPRATAAALAIGAGFAPFVVWLFVAWLIQRRSRLQAGAVFVALQLALHLPFVLAGWPARSAFAAWSSGLAGQAGGSAPDSALGLSELWFGHFVLHDWAPILCLGLSALACMRLRRSQLPYTIVVLAIATMIVRPQAATSWQLWLYPFLLLIALRAETEWRSALLCATAALDLATVLANPLLWSLMRREVGALDPGAALERGAAWTLVFSISVLLKLVLLVGFARTLAREPARASQAPEPLHWPRIDLAAWSGWLRKPSLALWLVAALIIAQSAIAGSKMLHVPRYSDEVSHMPQIRHYCEGDPALHPTLTMLPGYHAVSALLASWLGDCSLEGVRKFSPFWGLGATLIAFLILRSLGARSPAMRTASFHFLPVIFPYHFFVYTDVLALLLVLLVLYLTIHRYYWMAGLIGAVSISIRQTNALLLILIVGIAWFDTDRSERFWVWARSLIQKSWASVLGLLGFAIFVYRNHGVAIGDRDAHEVGLHVGNVFFVLFLLALVALPANLERISRERRRLLQPSFGFALLALYLSYAYLFKVEHRYNHHEFFLRNAVVLWATGDVLRKALCFVPIALGFAALWTTPLVRTAYWVWIPVCLLGLLPEALIEQRYAIVPLGLWMLLRRDASPFAEALGAVFNFGLSTWLLELIASGRWAL
jgi:alpha-1,2-glucosyltransferase